MLVKGYYYKINQQLLNKEISKTEFDKRFNLYYRLKRQYNDSRISLSQFNKRIKQNECESNRCSRCTIMVGKEYIHKKMYKYKGENVCLSCLKKLS